ncbi:hypothetical protein [uncultured Pseudokineococcus sp.]|uniref:hypothetical protein n=1 Tax=uncultured Pseudokineococcus sp. TaxID=1642928 RepID=UPI0026370DD5|nr:hypothetical protein [uncultured Pseudokineococcus sp.]
MDQAPSAPASTSREGTSLRRRLEQAVLPAAPPAPPGGVARRGLLLLGAVVLAGAVSRLRLSPAEARTIWAEDGGRFLSAQLADGFWASLAEPYAGYMHLAPRLGAAVADAFPLAWAESVLAACASAVVGLCAVATGLLSRGHLPSRAVRALLAAAVVLLPVAGFEAVGNVANSHWYLMAASFWALAARPSRTGEVVLAAAVVVLAAASDPLTVILAPLVVVRLLLLRRARDHVVTLAFTGGTAAQLAVVLGTDRGDAPPPAPVDVLSAYVVRVPVELVLGPGRAESLLTGDGAGRAAALAVTAVVLAVAAVAAAAGPWRLRWIALAGALASLAFFVVPVTVSWAPALSVALGPQLDLASVSRYSVVPQLLLLVLVAAGLQALVDLAPSPAALGAAAVVVLLLAASAVSGYRPGWDVREGPSWDVGLAAARQLCEDDPARASADVPIAPDPERWRAVVPCARLR